MCLSRRQVGFRRLAVPGPQLNVENLALADTCDPLYTQGLKRPLDGLALGVEDAGFQGNRDAGLHGSIDLFDAK